MAALGKESDTARRRRESAVWEAVEDPNGEAKKVPSHRLPVIPSAEPPLPGHMQLALVGFAGGILSAALGIGGGIVMVPLLTLWLGQRLSVATAASVAAIVISSSIGVLSEEVRNLLAGNGGSNIEWQSSLLLGLGAVVGIRMGMLVRQRLPERALALAFGIVLVLCAAKLSGLFTLVGASNTAVLDGVYGDAGVPTSVWVALMLILGCIGGLTVPLFGLGGGVIYVPGLAILFKDFELAQVARGTSLGAVLINSGYTCLLMARSKSLPFALVARLAPGNAVGAIAGVVLANTIDSGALKVVIAVFIAAGGVRMAIPRKKPA